MLLERITTDNRKILSEPEILHPGENEIVETLEDYTCKVFEFNEAKINLPL